MNRSFLGSQQLPLTDPSIADRRLGLNRWAGTLARSILYIPALRFLIDLGKPFRAYRNFLNRCTPARMKFRGVYSSFEEARAHAPKGIPYGYDHPETARIYQDYAEFVRLADYPAIHWLGKALGRRTRVFDFGGNIGFNFYAFLKYLPFPEDVEWLVCELPAVAAEGCKFAREKKEFRVRFTTRVEDADGFAFFLAAGTLQYVEDSLADVLRELKDPPPNVLINRLPLHPSRACYTLQNIGCLVTPYRVFQRDHFIGELASLGYALVDSWADPEYDCWIPYYPEFSVPFYTGMYFVREE